MKNHPRNHGMALDKALRIVHASTAKQRQQRIARLLRACAKLNASRTNL